MENTISQLLTSYENGGMSRRALVRGLALLAAGSAGASAAGFQGSSINHVALNVGDLKVSSEYYSRVLNAKAQNRPDGSVAVSLGKGRLVLRKGSPAARVDHFAIGIEQFNKDAVIADLKARGVVPSEAGDAGLHVVDPDGYPVQLISGDGV